MVPASSLHNVIFGPRVSFSAGKFTPFVHALVGASHLSGGGASDTSFSDALGGGLDYRLIHCNRLALSARRTANPILQREAERRPLLHRNRVAFLMARSLELLLAPRHWSKMTGTSNSARFE